MADPGPKQHHYLPEFYLNGFANDKGLLWIYDWKMDQYREQSPHNTCKENNFNTLYDEDGNRVLDAETFYSIIEGLGKSVIDDLRANKSLDGQQISDLAYFVACMYSRIPAFREMYIKGADSIYKQVLKSSVRTKEDAVRFMKGDATDPQAVLDFIHNEKFNIVPHQNVIIQNAVEMAAKLHEIFSSQEWLVLSCDPKKSFVTSDAPLTRFASSGFRPMGPGGGLGVSIPGVEKRIPLAAGVFLVILDQGERTRYRDIDHLAVRHLNLCTAARSDRFLIARDRALLENLVNKVREQHRHGYQVSTQFIRDDDGRGGFGVLSQE